MDLENRVIEAKESNEKRDAVINDYRAFIASCASKALKHHISESDDAYSVAMIAFNDAITKYDADKGNFLSFAAVIIRRRITDYLRQEYRHKHVIPESSVEFMPEPVYEAKFFSSDAAMEIEELTKELSEFNISFFDLPKVSPKSCKTKHACMSVISYVSNNQDLIKTLKKKKTLPAKAILYKLHINDKILERHRKYIIAGILILSGDYGIMSEYFKGKGSDNI